MTSSKQLRVYHMQNGEMHYYRVNSVVDGEMLIDLLAQADLLNPSVEMNAFGLEEFDEETGDYIEYYGIDGDDIIALMDEEDDKYEEDAEPDEDELDEIVDAMNFCFNQCDKSYFTGVEARALFKAYTILSNMSEKHVDKI